MGFVLESATWRSNADWGAKLGYSPEQLDALNRQSIDLLVQVRDELETTDSPMPISGNIGPLGDGYVAGKMSADDAERLHTPQVQTFAKTQADLVSAFTMTSTDEAIGVTRAAVKAEHAGGDFLHGRDRRPPADRADLEAGDRDGRCRDRRGAGLLHDQLRAPDPLRAGAGKATRPGSSGCAASAPMPRCAATPSSTPRPTSTTAIRSSSASNTARCGSRFRQFTVLGGCCGTDHRHVEQICFACSDAAGAEAAE